MPNSHQTWDFIDTHITRSFHQGRSGGVQEITYQSSTGLLTVKNRSSDDNHWFTTYIVPLSKIDPAETVTSADRITLICEWGGQHIEYHQFHGPGHYANNVRSFDRAHIYTTPNYHGGEVMTERLKKAFHNLVRIHGGGSSLF